VTWDTVTCTKFPVYTEFNKHGIIQMETSSTEGLPDQTSISLNFVASEDGDGVLLHIESKDTKYFITLQMLAGLMVLSFDVGEGDVTLYPSTSLFNDLKLHTVRVTLSDKEVSLTVDDITESKPFLGDLSLFGPGTTVKVGGSSLNINYGFKGCLSNVSINTLQPLSLLDRDDVIIKDVELDSCSILPIEPEPPTVISKTSGVDDRTYLPPKTQSPPFINRVPTKNTSYTVDSTTSSAAGEVDTQNVRGDINLHPGRGPNEHVLIGTLLGIVTLLAMVMFITYFLWQKRQMRSEEKKPRDDCISLDHDITSEYMDNYIKTYNAKFTPHTLEMINEESETEGSCVGVAV